MTEQDWGALARHWLDRLAQCSEPGPGVTRLPFTPQHRAALEVLRSLMQGAGLAAHIDAAGTLVGRQEAPPETLPDTPVLLTGSHQDSVRHGGAYDGIMGVVLPVLALMRLRTLGRALPCPVEVLAFADEEGVRFPTALMGPRALAGTLDLATLDMTDRDGITLRDAMTGFGLSPSALPDLRRDPARVLAWVECHLEQGPVLEHAGQPLGVVTAICGIERHALTLTGMAAHAGTMPMNLRRDALAGASALVLAIEALARDTDGLLANVGRLDVSPGVVNAVPGQVDMTIEIRAPQDSIRAQARAQIAAQARAIAADRGLALTLRQTYAQPATPCDAGMIAALADAVRGAGGSGVLLASGATHDTSAMADLCPVGMIFTACAGGISHNPAEHVPDAVLHSAVVALSEALLRIGDRI